MYVNVCTAVKTFFLLCLDTVAIKTKQDLYFTVRFLFLALIYDIKLTTRCCTYVHYYALKDKTEAYVTKTKKGEKYDCFPFGANFVVDSTW